MSILSAVTIGAAASKKCREPPQSRIIFSARVSLVKGPVAITVIASLGMSVISFSMTSIRGLFLIFSVTIEENLSLSTAKAPPAGTLHLSAHSIKTEPICRISSLRSPAALLSLSALREFEQISSLKFGFLWAGVNLLGFISKSRTFIPCFAICQAASQPARPAPITFIYITSP